MSGGSYNYLCRKSADDLFTDSSELEHMADDLARSGHFLASDMTREILHTIRVARTRIEFQSRILQPIWKAQEWYKSGDDSDAVVIEEYKKLTLLSEP